MTYWYLKDVGDEVVKFRSKYHHSSLQIWYLIDPYGKELQKQGHTQNVQWASQLDQYKCIEFTVLTFF